MTLKYIYIALFILITSKYKISNILNWLNKHMIARRKKISKRGNKI